MFSQLRMIICCKKKKFTFFTLCNTLWNKKKHPITTCKYMLQQFQIVSQHHVVFEPVAGKICQTSSDYIHTGVSSSIKYAPCPWLMASRYSLWACSFSFTSPTMCLPLMNASKPHTENNNKHWSINQSIIHSIHQLINN